MYLERLLQINMATLAALGALLLGMGQRDAKLPLMVIAAAALSLWLTDVAGRLRLNRTAANLATLAAVALSLGELLRIAHNRLAVLAVANLLVYLQVVLLFQKKDHRVYRQLAVLSLLQVVVAAAYNQGVWYAGLLVVYMLVGMSALALMFFHRQWEQHRGNSGLRPPAAERAEFIGAAAGKLRAAVGREWFARLALMGLGTLALTLLIFLAVPRFGRTAWQGALVAPRRLVGFDDKVTLGELGQIIESPRQVMRVWLTDPPGGQSHPAVRELYLRGAILTRYKDNAWRGERKKGGTPLALPGEKTAAAPLSSLVEQKIEIAPMRDRDELFAVWPFVPIEPNDNLLYDPASQRLLRPPAQRAFRFVYKLGTTAFDRARQTPLTPCKDAGQLDSLLQLPDLPKLEALAGQWIEQSGLPAADRIGRARALEQQFHDPAKFRYSLQGQPRDASIDNIEDFLTKNPRGHCEYFATALTLMLRSRDIPARMVVGYRCDEYNDLGDFYQVRQLHAHTWVEAYLEAEQIPRQLREKYPAGYWAAGGWLRLEPTPGGSSEQSGAGAVLGGMGKGLNWLQSLWENYVMEMDRSRQRRAIYGPVVRALRAAVQRLGDPVWWRGLAARIGRALRLSAWFSAGGWWRWVALAFFVALLGAASICFGPPMARRLRDRLAGRAGRLAGSQLPEVDFYRRFTLLAARHGLVRSVGQTHREFAVAAGQKLAAAARRPRLAALTPQIANAFYQVRFGHLPLDSPQASALEQALSELETRRIP